MLDSTLQYSVRVKIKYTMQAKETENIKYTFLRKICYVMIRLALEFRSDKDKKFAYLIVDVLNVFPTPMSFSF